MIVDEIDDEMELQSDPLLECGMDIPGELPHAKTKGKYFCLC